MSPKLVPECVNCYDTKARCIRKNNGEVLIFVSWETIMSILKILEEFYLDFTPTLSFSKFNEFPKKHHSVIARYWKEKICKGGSHLPKSPNKDQIKQHVHDLVMFLHRVKGSLEALRI